MNFTALDIMMGKCDGPERQQQGHYSQGLEKGNPKGLYMKENKNIYFPINKSVRKKQCTQKA